MIPRAAGPLCAGKSVKSGIDNTRGTHAEARCTYYVCGLTVAFTTFAGGAVERDNPARCRRVYTKYTSW